MILKYHKNLTQNRWEKFPLYQRILMIATELVRAKSWLEKNDFLEVQHCYERALELLDLTITIAKGNFLRELLRFRELLAENYFKNFFNLEENQILYQVLISLNKRAFNSLVK
jgi:hypothetical protein